MFQAMQEVFSVRAVWRFLMSACHEFLQVRLVAAWSDESTRDGVLDTHSIIAYLVENTIMDVWDDLNEYGINPWYDPWGSFMKVVGPLFRFFWVVFAKSPVFWLILALWAIRRVYLYNINRGSNPGTPFFSFPPSFSGSRRLGRGRMSEILSWVLSVSPGEPENAQDLPNGVNAPAPAANGSAPAPAESTLAPVEDTFATAANTPAPAPEDASAPGEDTPAPAANTPAPPAENAPNGVLTNGEA